MLRRRGRRRSRDRGATDGRRGGSGVGMEVNAGELFCFLALDWSELSGECNRVVRRKEIVLVIVKGWQSVPTSSRVGDWRR